MGTWEGSKLLDIFEQFDVNGDGIIQRSELKRILEKLSGRAWKDADIQMLAKAADTDQNGLIDYQDSTQKLFSPSFWRGPAKQLAHHREAHPGLTKSEEALDEQRMQPGAGAKAKSEREQKFPLNVIKTGLTMQLENAKASVDSDRVHILNCIAGRDDLELEPLAEHPAYTRVNQQLRAIFARAAWPQAVKRNLVESLGLPKTLRSDTDLVSLNLGLGKCKKLGGRQLALLGQGIPQGLKSLELDLSLTQTGNAGLAALVKGIPPGLVWLRLHFYKCWQVGGAGVAAIASALPATLQTLALNFSHCEGIEDSGLAALGQGLARLEPSLTRVKFNFTSCQGIGDDGLGAMVQGLPRTLQSLLLNVAGCEHLTDLGLAAVGLALPLQLHELKIVSPRTNFGDEGLAGLARGLEKADVLERFDLCVSGCERVSSSGLAAIAAAIPSGVVELSLGFDYTKIGDGGLAAVGQRIAGLGSLRALCLTTNSSLVGDAGTWALVRALPATVTELPLQASNGWQFWGNGQHSLEATAHFTNLATLRSWCPEVPPADPGAAAVPPRKQDLEAKLPAPLGQRPAIDPAVPVEPAEAALLTELMREPPTDYVQFISPAEVVINVPSPCLNGEASTPDEKPLYFDVTGLAPMRRVLLQFSGIHNSHFIGVNRVRILNGNQDVSFEVVTAGAGLIRKNSNGLPKGWWAEAGDDVEVILDFGTEQRFTALGLHCANANATPKCLRVVAA